MRPALPLALLAVLAASLPAGAARAADLPVAPYPQVPVPVEELKKELMKALGDDFEFLGGELGRTRATAGTWAAERFWFAKVRAKKAGNYAVSYSIRFDFELTAAQKADRNWPSSAEYLILFAVGEKGAPRVFHPFGFGGSAHPHANVGDTLVIPIHVDRHQTGHKFSVPDPAHPQVKAFFGVAGEATHDAYMKLGAETPVVKNDTGGRVKVLTSWGNSITNRPGTLTHHQLYAYAEFAAPGEYALAGRPTGADDKFAGDGVSFRVVAKDRPVTVVVEYVKYFEQSNVNFTSVSIVKPGALEARVGDRVLVSTSGASGAGIDRPKEYRPGVLVVRPFKASDAYTPDPKK